MIMVDIPTNQNKPNTFGKAMICLILPDIG